MPDVAVGTRHIHFGSGLAIVALSVMLIVASPLGLFGVALGWALLVILSVLDLLG